MVLLTAMLGALVPVKKVLMPRAARVPLVSSPKPKVTLELLLAMTRFPAGLTVAETMPPPAAVMEAASELSEVCVPWPERLTLICLVVIWPVDGVRDVQVEGAVGRGKLMLVVEAALRAAVGSRTLVVPVRVEKPARPWPWEWMVLTALMSPAARLSMV